MDHLSLPIHVRIKTSFLQSVEAEEEHMASLLQRLSKHSQPCPSWLRPSASRLNQMLKSHSSWKLSSQSIRLSQTSMMLGFQGMGRGRSKALHLQPQFRIPHQDIHMLWRFSTNHPLMHLQPLLPSFLNSRYLIPL